MNSYFVYYMLFDRSAICMSSVSVLKVSSKVFTFVKLSQWKWNIVEFSKRTFGI